MCSAKQQGREEADACEGKEEREVMRLLKDALRFYDPDLLEVWEYAGIDWSK